MIKNDLVGKRFGKLIALSPTNKRYNRNVIWTCRCDCGEYKEVSRNTLLSGRVKSCGCLLRNKDRTSVYKKIILSRIKQSAKTKNRIFELSDDLAFELSQQSCFYCGYPPYNYTIYKPDNLLLSYSGLDRIDSNKDYIDGNVVPCCKRCNAAKNNLMLDDFKIWIRAVYNKTILNLNNEYEVVEMFDYERHEAQMRLLNNLK